MDTGTCRFLHEFATEIYRAEYKIEVLVVKSGTYDSMVTHLGNLERLPEPLLFQKARERAEPT